MSVALPPELKAAISRRLERVSGGFREGAARLSETYRKGGNAKADFDAYLVTRLPATFAAVTTAFEELSRIAPDFAPKSLLDAGAGPGTASWAAREIWKSLDEVTFADKSGAFLEIARELASSTPAFANARCINADILREDELPKADLVVAAYTFAELSESKIAAVIRSLWTVAQTLVIVEPGTPAGFARIHAAREELIRQGAFIAAPCPHRNACPIVDPDWCHFSVRLPRSRAHMHAKKASVPFEDEKFSYVIAMREPVSSRAVRLLAPPDVSKAAINLKLCTLEGLERRTVARRDGGAYKSAKKLVWGDSMRGTET
ncbi:MAG: small ribosomal subunit Rsm22 family protein [Aestuariivirga sp.]